MVKYFGCSFKKLVHCPLLAHPAQLGSVLHHLCATLHHLVSTFLWNLNSHGDPDWFLPLGFLSAGHCNCVNISIGFICIFTLSVMVSLSSLSLLLPSDLLSLLLPFVLLSIIIRCRDRHGGTEAASD